MKGAGNLIAKIRTHEVKKRGNPRFPEDITKEENENQKRGQFDLVFLVFPERDREKCTVTLIPTTTQSLC